MSILSGARGDSTIDPFGGGSAPVVTVSNPAAGGGASVPTGTAGSPNAAVVTVQGIASGIGLAVSVSNLPSTQAVSIAAMPTTPVTGTFWQTTQPVSGTVTVNAGTGTFTTSPTIGGAAVSASNPIPFYDAFLAPTNVVWTSATAVNTAATSTTAGYDTVIVTLVGNAALAGGSIVFEVYDGATWLLVKGASVSTYTGATTVAMANSLSVAYQVPVAGFPQFRARLAAALTAGQVTVTTVVSSAPDTSIVTVGMDPMQPLPAGTNQIGSVSTGGFSIVTGGAFTRPANTTAYASGQLVANSTTAASVTPITCTVARIAAGTGQIFRARLSKSGTSVTNAIFRVHLYRVSPTASNGDGAAWLTDNAANYIGSLDLTMSKAFTDGAKGIGAPTEGGQIFYSCASGSQNLYALIEARAAYTPVSGETFTLTLEASQD